MNLHRMTIACLIFLGQFFLMGSVISGPFGDNCLPVSPTENEVDYQADIQPLLDENCVHCHQPGTATFDEAGLDLRPGQSYWTLMNELSAGAFDGFGLPLVAVAGNQSPLMTKLVCIDPGWGEPMPPDAPRLSQDDLNRVFSWISLGPMPGTETDPGAVTQPGLAGSWYNPDTPGQGLMVDLFELRGRQRVNVYWFTFSDDENEPEQRWYFADGAMNQNRAVARLTIFQSTGGVFDRPEPEADLEQVGDAVIKFDNCTEATLAYRLASDVEAEPVTGEIPLERLSPTDECVD